MMKDELLAEIGIEWRLLEQQLASLDETQMVAPDSAQQGWSVKDMLTHIIAWEKFLLDRLATIMTGQAGRYPPILSEEDVHVFNASVYAENRERPLSEVRLEFRSLYNGILAVLEALDEEMLTQPAPFDWADERLTVRDIICANTCWHYKEHREEMERRMQDQ